MSLTPFPNFSLEGNRSLILFQCFLFTLLSPRRSTNSQCVVQFLLLPSSPGHTPEDFTFYVTAYSPPPGTKKETIPRRGTPIYLKCDCICNRGGRSGFCAAAKTYVWSKKILRRETRDNHVEISTLSKIN